MKHKERMEKQQKYRQKYYLANREKYAAYQKEYYLNHKRELSEKAKKRRRELAAIEEARQQNPKASSERPLPARHSVLTSSDVLHSPPERAAKLIDNILSGRINYVG